MFPSKKVVRLSRENRSSHLIIDYKVMSRFINISKLTNLIQSVSVFVTPKRMRVIKGVTGADFVTFTTRIHRRLVSFQKVDFLVISVKLCNFTFRLINSIFPLGLK